MLVVAVLGSLGGLAMWRANASKGAVDERAVLLAQADSLFATLEAIGHRDARISGALDGAKAETARLRSRIRRAPRDRQVLAPLRDSLERLTSSFERLAAAAALDAQQIARTNEASLAVVEATYEDGTRRTAAAFAARRAAGSLVFVTVQDILLDSAGHPPATLTLQASGAAKPLRTRALGGTRRTQRRDPRGAEGQRRGHSPNRWPPAWAADWSDRPPCWWAIPARGPMPGHALRRQPPSPP